jgi:hypothetical protein
MALAVRGFAIFYTIEDQGAVVWIKAIEPWDYS